MPIVKYDVLELKYSDGSPGVLRHIDGSGFAYYQSGRKAICVSSHGKDGKGFPRRFGAIVHGDSQRAPILGLFDEWGRGYADGQMNVGDIQPPKVLISQNSVSVIDGTGMGTEVPLGRSGAAGKQGQQQQQQQQSAGSADVALRVNASVTMEHRLGRTTLHFRCGEVQHSFVVGELQGDEVQGMAQPEPRSLADETMRQLGEATQKLATMREKVATIKVDSSQRDTKPAMTVDTKSFKDVLENMHTLTQSLSHPNLASPGLDWNTEGRLRQLLVKAHPQCPGPQDRRNWSIAKYSGKCTEERLKNTKATVATPKTVKPVSQLQLPELIDETSSKGTLLVVVCLATYAFEQSNYAKLVAEKAHAELCKKFGNTDGDGTSGNSEPPVKLVTVEMTETGGFAQQYGVKEAPYCLMFQGGHAVYSKRLRGMRTAVRDGATTLRPRVLLMEANPAHQLKLERNLRRNGYSSDLAPDGPRGLQLASRQQPYGILLVSALLRAEHLRAAVAAVRRLEPDAVILAFDAAMPTDEDPEARRRFFDECSHVFPYVPSYTAIAAVLARFEGTHLSKMTTKVVGGDHKQDFVDEVMGVLEGKRTGGN